MSLSDRDIFSLKQGWKRGFGDDDALVAIGKLAHKGLAHGAFAGGIAGALDIGGGGQQGQHTVFAQLAQAGQVDDLAVDGGGVDLEVGMDHSTHLGMDGKGHGVGDGVVDVDKFHLEFAGFHRLAGFHGDELGGVHQAVLGQLELDEACRQACAVDGQIDLLEDVGDGTDVVLVTVGDEETAQAVLVLDQIGYVGDHAVDAVHVLLGEGHAAVHHDDLAAVLIYGHVLADLIETAKGNDFQFFSHRIKILLYCVKDDPRPTGQKRQKCTAKQRRPVSAGPASPLDRGVYARPSCM